MSYALSQISLNYNGINQRNATKKNSVRQCNGWVGPASGSSRPGVESQYWPPSAATATALLPLLHYVLPLPTATATVLTGPMGFVLPPQSLYFGDSLLCCHHVLSLFAATMCWYSWYIMLKSRGGIMVNESPGIYSHKIYEFVTKKYTTFSK